MADLLEHHRVSRRDVGVDLDLISFGVGSDVDITTSATATRSRLLTPTSFAPVGTRSEHHLYHNSHDFGSYTGTAWNSLSSTASPRNTTSMTMTTKMFSAKNSPDNWNNLTRAGKDSNSFDRSDRIVAVAEVKVKMEKEMTESLDISEGQVQGQGSNVSNSRSSSPTESHSNGDVMGNKLLRVDTKICGVCGDKALGNNFNAITCESCKAFFRRNALKTKESTCPFSNSCKVDPVTRRFCQKCRLKKCFDIGMKKEWIMSDEEKKVKKIKIEQNRLKRQSSDALPSPSPSQSSSDSPPVSKAACLVGEPNNKYSCIQSPSPLPSPSFPQHHQQHHHLSHPHSHQHSMLAIPQNSPPDPTLPHKIAKQPMMPHNCDESSSVSLSSPLPSPSPSPLSSSSATSISLFQQQQLSPVSPILSMHQIHGTLPLSSPSSSTSSTNSCSTNTNNPSSGSGSAAALGINLKNGSNNSNFIQQLTYEANSNVSCATTTATVTPVTPATLSISSMWCDSNGNNGSTVASDRPTLSIATAGTTNSSGVSHGIDNSSPNQSQNHLILRIDNAGDTTRNDLPNYANNGNGSGVESGITSGNTNLSHGQPLPLLSSLIRPTSTESPPEAQFISDFSNGPTGYSSSSIPPSFPKPSSSSLTAIVNVNTSTNGPHTRVNSHHQQQHSQQEQSPSSPIFSTIRNSKMNSGNGNSSSSYNDITNAISGKSDLISACEGTVEGFSSSNYCSHPDERQRLAQRHSHLNNRVKNRRSASGIRGVVDVDGSEDDPDLGEGDVGFSLNIQDMLGGHQERIYPNDDFMSHPLNTMDSIMNVAITAEFNGYVLSHGSGGGSGSGNSGGSGRGCGSRGSGVSVLNSTQLNLAEQSKLNELLRASEALNAPVDAEGPVKVSDPSLINVINLTDIAIRRLIQMSKKISGFKSMCQEDQVALLKGSCTEMMILRSVVSYDPDRDSWNIPHSNVGYNIKLGVLKEARGNLYEEHQRFVKSFKSEWRSNENIMMILCAITLFTSERANVIHKEAVQLEQHSYVFLLKRYLESTLNGCEARTTYLQLIRKIEELHVLNTNHLRVFLEVNPREVEPLLIEIFDLK